MRRLLGASRHDREIFRLGLPALGALAADPLVSLVDTAFVGRLGADALGSLAVAAVIFGVAFGVFNFLAYGTTPLVAGALGRDDPAEASRVAVAALVVAVLVGVAAGVVLIGAADPLLRVVGADAATLEGARTYLRIRSLALPAAMLVTAGHGIFRGFANTRTPFVATAALNIVNLVLDPILIFGFDRGLAGAAWATAVAQWVGAAWFLVALARRGEGVRRGAPRPTTADYRRLLTAGGALVIRTGSILGITALATAVAARVGTSEVAAHQIAWQIWLFLSLVVDALAIAAQTMVATALVRDPREAAEISRRLLLLGLALGIVVGAGLAALGPWLPGWFTPDESVRDALRSIYPIVVIMQPVNAVVFVWDGIVLGASEFRFLAIAMAVAGLVSSAVLLAVLPMGWGLAGVWWGLAVQILSRAGLMTWWHLSGPLSSPDPSPASRAA